MFHSLIQFYLLILVQACQMWRFLVGFLIVLFSGILLFLIYINDPAECCNRPITVLCANDVNLTLTIW